MEVPDGMSLALASGVSRIDHSPKAAALPPTKVLAPSKTLKRRSRSASKSAADSYGGAVAPPPRARAQPASAADSHRSPFPPTTAAGVQSKERTGLTMPRGTASLAEIDRWAQKLDPAQKLELLRVGGPSVVVEAVIAEVAKDGGILAHADQFTKDEHMFGLALQREARALSEDELSIRYHTLASSPIADSHQPQMERLLRMEYLEKALHIRFHGRMDLGDD